MSRMVVQKKADGKYVMRCKAHGTPYSVFYASEGFFRKEEAFRRIEEFRIGHCFYSPDCSLDAKVEDIPAHENGNPTR